MLALWVESNLNKFFYSLAISLLQVEAQCWIKDLSFALFFFDLKLLSQILWQY